MQRVYRSSCVALTSVFLAIPVAVQGVAKDAVGTLTQRQNFSSGDGTRDLEYVLSIAVSPDNLNVYTVGDRDDGDGGSSHSTGRLSVFARNDESELFAQTNVLALPNSSSLRGVTVSNDGKSVYVVGMSYKFQRHSYGDDDHSSLWVLSRDASNPSNLTVVETFNSSQLPPLFGAESVAVSPNGDSVYVASKGHNWGSDDPKFSGALVVFQRDAANGAISFQ